jgi:hypothetical protein
VTSRRSVTALEPQYTQFIPPAPASQSLAYDVTASATPRKTSIWRDF